jgi:hypothetical protein
MRWIRTINGDRAHAILRSGQKRTICGIAVTHAAAIVIPGPDDRCGNCDFAWRELGRARKPGPAFVRDYAAPFTFDDWEKE